LIFRSREAYVGLVALVATPSLFASNSLYSLDQMPMWLRLIAEVNPVTYAVTAVRAAIIYNSFSLIGLLADFGAMFLFSGAMLAFAAFLFSRIGH